MHIVVSIIASIYIVGFVLIFAMHTQMPVTFGLALLRSLLWPIWILTGVPHGQPMLIDCADMIDCG